MCFMVLGREETEAEHEFTEAGMSQSDIVHIGVGQSCVTANQ